MVNSCNNCDKYYYATIQSTNNSDRLDINYTTGWQAGGSQTGFSFKKYIQHEFITEPYVSGAVVNVYNQDDELVFTGIVGRITRFLYPNEEGIEVFVEGLSYVLGHNIIDNTELYMDIGQHITRILNFSNGLVFYNGGNVGISVALKYDYQTCQNALDELSKMLDDEKAIVILPTGELVIRDVNTTPLHIFSIGGDIKDLDLSYDETKVCNRLVVKWTEEVLVQTQQVAVNPNNLPTFDSQGGTVYPCPISVGQQWYLTDTNETITANANVQTCPLINGASYFSFTPPTIQTVFSYRDEPRVSIYNDVSSQGIYGVRECVIDAGKTIQIAVDAQAQSYFDKYAVPSISGKIVVYCADSVVPYDKIAIVNYDSIHNIYIPYFICTGVDTDNQFQTIYLNNPDEFVDELRALL